MKYARYLAIGLAIATLISVFLIVYRNRPQNNTAKTTNTATENKNRDQTWGTKINDQTPITVTATPLDLAKSSSVWKFSLVLDTHSGSLDQNLTQTATLIDDKNNVYQPLAWDGAGPGGHHREGILSFKAINPPPQFIELKLKDIGDTAEMLFRWEIK